MKDWNIFLASASPRRKFLLKRAGFRFTVFPSTFEEVYPADMNPELVPEYLALKKAEYVKHLLQTENDLIISADTIVIKDNVIFGKPKDENDALRMLTELSGARHSVITGICLMNKSVSKTFSEKTEVVFSDLSQQDLIHYIKNYKPFDKAGAYAIQEWIGLVGIQEINGCYTNVVGLPVNRLFNEISKL